MFVTYSGCGFSNAYIFILSLHRNHAVTFLCYGSYHDKTGVYIHFFKGISYHFSMKQKFLEWFYIIVDVPFQVIFILIALSGLLLTCVRFFAIHSLWLLIPIWTLVIYTSVMTIYWIWLFISSKRLQEDLEVFEIMQKNSLGLCLSMELNLLMSIYYAYVSIRYHNQWFIDSAFFYASLTAARFAMLRTYQFDKPSMLQQYRLYMMIGYLMFAMMSCLFLMTVMIVNEHYIVHYPGHSLYAAAGFSLYLIVSAVGGFLRHRHYRSPLLSGNQMISISAALLGVLSLQTAFLPMFTDNAETHRILNLATGTVVFAIMIIMSAHMVIRGGRKVDYYLAKYNES